MKLAVIGTGYVGLVAGTCFAETGNDVICVDIDRNKIEGLRKGKIPIYEPGLAELLRRNVEQERLGFTDDLARAVQKSSLVFIAVGTPSGEDGSSDLRYVLKAAEQIGDAMNERKIVVTKSTVPVGTAEQVRQVLAARTHHPFEVVSNPEFLKEGSAIDDFMKPDRVVIGADNREAAETLRELYQPFTRTGAPILVMDPRSAEMTKYAANAMLASRISFMNEIARLCETVQADVHQVRQGIGMDRRLGPTFLFPGLGYGGSCFPKDIRALIHLGRQLQLPIPLLEAIEEVNNRQKHLLVEKVLQHFQVDRNDPQGLSGKLFAVWGLSFKPQTDDMREAPSIVTIDRLLQSGAKICAYDPEAAREARKIFQDRIAYAGDNYAALRGADALLLLTEWNVFRNPDFGRMKRLLKEPVIFDGRNQYSPSEMKTLGFRYFGIGRPSSVP